MGVRITGRNPRLKVAQPARRIKRVVSEALDDLARSLAKPMPRRATLRLLARAFVWAALPTALRPARAEAACPDCPKPGESLCSVPRRVGCLRTCCPTGTDCCKARDEVSCCPKNTHTCGKRNVGRTELTTCTRICPPPQKGCKDRCCDQYQICDYSVCVCPERWTRCGGTCCGPDQECMAGECRCTGVIDGEPWSGVKLCGRKCCKPREECCPLPMSAGGGTICCDSRHKCCPLLGYCQLKDRPC